MALGHRVFWLCDNRGYLSCKQSEGEAAVGIELRATDDPKMFDVFDAHGRVGSVWYWEPDEDDDQEGWIATIERAKRTRAANLRLKACARPGSGGTSCRPRRQARDRPRRCG